MLCLLQLFLSLVAGFFRSRRDLLMENLALRQQLTILKPQHPHPRVAVSDKLVWLILRRLWYGLSQLAERPHTTLQKASRRHSTASMTNSDRFHTGGGNLFLSRIVSYPKHSWIIPSLFPSAAICFSTDIDENQLKWSDNRKSS